MQHLTDIPLSKLRLSRKNVRRTKAPRRANAELEASIASHGLIQNLVVEATRCEAGTTYNVTAGGRRLAALRSLARKNKLAADTPVPCLVLTGQNAKELSTAENAARHPLTPIDEFRAYQSLAKDGMSVDNIATRFGVPKRKVEQRLRLANVASAILCDHRNGLLTLEQVTAFTISTDHARQCEVWRQIQSQPFGKSAWQIRAMLTEDQVKATDALAHFVGLSAYRRAGGTTTEDLFADHDDRGIYLHDPKLLRTLAKRKLNRHASRLKREWSWVETVVSYDYKRFRELGRFQPVPGKLTRAETAQRMKLVKRLQSLQDSSQHPRTAAHRKDLHRTHRELAQLDAAMQSRDTFSKLQRAHAGCIVTIGSQGEIRVIQGLIRNNDMQRYNEAARTHRAPGAAPLCATAPCEPPHRTRDPDTIARKKAGITAALAEELSWTRTALIRTHLQHNPEAAFDLALFHLARNLFPCPGGQAQNDTTPRPPLNMNAHTDPTKPQQSASKAAMHAIETEREQLEAHAQTLNLAWIGIEDEAESFKRLQSIARQDKEAIFAACVAHCVRPQLAFEPHASPSLEATAERLDIDFATHYRPCADGYWSRIPKRRILAIAQETLGQEWTKRHATVKKPELAHAMERAFSPDPGPDAGLTPQQHARALAWIPPGFAAFDPAPETAP